MENIYKNSKALLQKLSLLVEKKEENFENIKFELEKTIEKLHFANRALFALSATCEAIVGAKDEESLLQDICKIIVNLTGYRLAWVAYARNDARKSVIPVAQAGFEKGYLNTLKITWADEANGRGPTGSAIRKGKPVICDNILTDSSFLPWRSEARERGYSSSIALPLILEGKPVGALNIYAEEPGAFESHEVDLLVKLANSLTFGISSLRKQILNKQSEMGLKASEERYQTLIEQAPDSVIIIDFDLNIKEINLAASRILKYTMEELHRMKFKELIPEEEHPDFPKKMEALLKGETCFIEKNIRRKDGSVFLAELSCRVIPAGREVQIFLRDLTARRKMEQELSKIEKLETIGVLAGGIAHDFNNLLTGILGNISLSLFSTDSNHPAYKWLSAAEKASLRAKDLTHQLLNFSKGGNPVKEEASIGELIKESAFFSTSGSGIKCDLELPLDLWHVEADTNQLNQVMNNLIINAVHASPAGRKIIVSAENLILKGRQVTSLSPGKYIRIAIKDHGVGIPSENLNRIFDPFFTTKSKGTGLGLTSSHSIIKKHGGDIAVKSKVNSGTTFSIYLPALDKATLTPGKEEIPLIKGNGKILLMDDEQIVRDVASEMLKALGYEVVVTREGNETITKYLSAKESGKPFDLVILDLTVPGGKGGKETINSLFRIDPKVKVIASSGYSPDPVPGEWGKRSPLGFISKPYRLSDLVKTLQKVNKS